MSDYFDRVERELTSALRREQRRTATCRRGLRGRPRVVIGVVAALVVAVPASAAVTGMWRLRERDGLVRTAPRTVIAHGTSPEYGPWEAFVSDSTSGACFGLRLIDPPGSRAGTTSEGCGGPADAPATIAGGDQPLGTAAFGFVPATAVKVRMDSDRLTRTFPTFHHPARPGLAFYFASVPDIDPSRLTIVPLRRDGTRMDAVRVRG